MALGSEGMTDVGPVDRLTIQATHPGMAHFAGTGPAGKKCGHCKFRGYRREGQKSQKRRLNYRSIERGDWPEDLPNKTYRVRGCQKFHQLTGQHGPEIDKDWSACKYFEPTKQP